MLIINDLTLTLKGNGRKIVDGLSITLSRGDKIAVIGEEGDGKSTLMRHLYDGRLTADYITATGSVIMRGAVGYMPQFASETDGNTAVCDYIGNNVYDAIKYTDALALPAELLYSTRRLSELSGGERVKIRLFKLIADNPDVLLLDEPTNDLDANTLEALENFIIQTPKAVLFISHDATLLRRAARGIIHLEQVKRKTECRTTFAAVGYDEYIERRTAGIERQTRIAFKQREEFDAKMRRWQHIYDRVDHEQNTVSRQDPAGGRLLKKKMKSVLSQKRRFERERENLAEAPDSEEAIITRFPASAVLPTGKTVLDLDISDLFAGDKPLAKNVRLTVTGNTKLAIVGANGVGKSTLLKEIKRTLDGRNDLRVSYMPQDYSEVLRSGTPLDYLDTVKGVDLTYARQLLGNMRFTSAEMKCEISALSGGQQAKLIFLHAVLSNANVLLLDEPTRNFSPLSSPAVCDALKGFGGAIISVSHDRTYIDEVCDTVYELTENGLKLVRNDI